MFRSFRVNKGIIRDREKALLSMPWYEENANVLNDWTGTVKNIIL